MTARSLVVRNAEVDGRIADVHVVGDRIESVGGRIAGADFECDAGGGAVIPGLHDHHIHLLALAAARASTSVELAGDPSAFDALIRDAAATMHPGDWLRVVGFHEAPMGELDRDRLDALVPTAPVRVQHATGALWVLNSPALRAAHIEELDVDGAERDITGRLTGRLYGLDDALGDRVPRLPVDVGAVGAELAALGITGVTDLTPISDPSTVELLARSVLADDFPLDVTISGGLDLPDSASPDLRRGPVKLMAADHALPTPEALAVDIASAHRRGRPVAVHCASRAGLVIALVALEEAGPREGDRIEHGAVVPVELIPRLSDLGVIVVTQPSFVLDRGDRYLREVAVDEHADLWRCGRLVAAGVGVTAGSDAPYGDPDPWRSIVAAVDRRTRSGRPFGRDERVPADIALAMYLTCADAPAGATRSVAPGQPARLCVLDRPLADALRAPSRDAVRATVSRSGWSDAP